METKLSKSIKYKRRWVTLFLLLLFVSGNVIWSKVPQPPDSVGNIKEFNAYLEKLVNSGTPPGLSLVIVKNDSIVYNRGFGWADVPRKQPATPNTVYHWWSVTKIVTAMAILQLQEKGKLQLDDPVLKYLPFFKVKYPSKQSKAVTILNLLNHSSGIRDANFFTLLKWIHHEGDQPLHQSEFVEKVFPKYSKLKFEPGENTLYTNVGYMLLGAIIEKVSHLSYEDYIRQNILIPLGMNQTEFVYTKGMDSLEAAGSHPAYTVLTPFLYLLRGSYVRETSGKHVWFERVYTDQTPSSALIGSTMDAAKLMRMYLNHGTLDSMCILSEKSVDLMTHEGYVAKLKSRSTNFHRRGIGWQVYKDNMGIKLEHAGGGPGFYTIMEVYPDGNLGLVLFCNDVTISSYGWKILRLAANLKW
jgi:D-alanyl-D-alanine carboxypeptidase